MPSLPAPRVPGVIAVAAIALAGLAAAQTSTGSRALRDAGLTADPERFTALAFARPGGLPSTLTDGARVRVGFTMANREGSPRGYRWRLATERGTVDRGVLRVSPGETVAATASGRVRCRSERTQVSLRVESPRRTISFRAGCAAKKGDDVR